MKKRNLWLFFYLTIRDICTTEHHFQQFKLNINEELSDWKYWPCKFGKVFGEWLISYHGFSNEILSNCLLLFLKLLPALFFKFNGSFLPNSLDSKAIGNKNRKKIVLNKILDVIKFSSQDSFIHRKSIILLKYVEKTPIKPTTNATEIVQSHLVIRYKTINPTDMVRTVFAGSVFCLFIIIN